MKFKVSEIATKMMYELSSKLKDTNLLFVKASNGEITPEQVGLYLHNIYILLSKTSEHLKSANSAAIKKDHKEMSEYFKERFDIESGNQHWIGLDLSEFEFSQAVLDSFYLTPSMLKLINYVESLAVNQPESYLAYELFTGSLILGVAPVLQEKLQMNCGISTKQLQVIERYQRVHNDYNLIDLEALDRLIKPAAYSNVEKSIRTTNKLFHDFFTEVASSNDKKQTQKR